MVISAEPEVLDEDALLARARAGDADAFCRMMGALQARLLRQAAGLCGDLATAEDLVSETQVEAWKSLGHYNQTCRFSTWLYAILLHRHGKLARRARCRPISLAWLPFFRAQDAQDRQANLSAPQVSPAEALEQSEAGAQIRRCVDLLPSKHREVIRLRFYEGASLSDMAAVLGCSPGTVKSRLFHALGKLRKMKMNLRGEKGDRQA